MEANENELINQDGEAFWDLGRAEDIEPRVSELCAAVRAAQPAFFMTEKANELRAKGCDDETILLDAVHAGYVKLCKALKVQYIEDIHPSVAVEHLRGLPVLEDGGLVPYLDLIKTIEASYRSIGQVVVMLKARDSQYVYEFSSSYNGVEKPAKLVVSISNGADFVVDVQVQLDGYVFREDYLSDDAEDESWEEVTAKQFLAASPTQDSLVLELHKPFHDAVEYRLGVLHRMLADGVDWLSKAESV
ncbi:hypothetical protein DBA29_20275 [Xenophilus aerolatus]|nr:hypothetical protein [Xenophilus aerolatus]